jgi:hypothetical protein
MKYISKMMLALLASVTLIIPAYAWDFGASGSVEALWEQVETKPNSGESKSPKNFSSASGGVSITSGHTEGDKSLTLKYSADVDTDGDTLGTDTGLDQTLSLAASTKAGKWTASATASQSIMEDGKTDQIAADDDAAITLTDGSITYVFGDASHLSTAEKVADTTSGGAVDAEARVDGFNGFSVGLPVGPGALTVALDMNSGTATTLMGDQTVAVGCGGQMQGFGFNFAGNVGADLSLTFASGSTTASKATCTGDNASNSASGSTMGLGVAVPLGALTIGADVESSGTTTTFQSADTKVSQSGTEVSVSMSGIADGTVVAAVSSQTKTTTAGSTETKVETSGLEVGWKTSIGPTTFEIAYGNNAIKDGDTVTDIEIEMKYSF